MKDSPLHRRNAERHFKEARNKARRGALSARIAGKDNRLLPFDEIRAELRLENPRYQGRVQVPLDMVVGSMGRYQEFTREFLPLNNTLRERWINVETYAHAHGWPPVELFKVGDVYFVQDGNHRCAVARKMGNDTIEAHVWEFPEAVNIGPNDSLDEVLLTIATTQFETATQISQLKPEHGIQFTNVSGYRELQAQIEAMRQKLSFIDENEPDDADVVAAWYDLIYAPTLQVIHETELLQTFPGRTEADLFAWLSLYREQLSGQYEYDTLSDLAQMLAAAHAESTGGRLRRTFGRLIGRKSPPPLENDPNSAD